MERMKDGDVIAFNGVVYKYCTGGTCLQCSLRNTRLCDHLKCFNGEHFEVLKGAEVIEMPSEEDITKQYAAMMVKHKEYDLYTSVQVHIRVIEWLKSKIVK